MSTTIEELVKATASLTISRNLFNQTIKSQPEHVELHKVLRDGVIQRFEYCIELAWKISIKLLGLQTKAPNPAIRDMAQNHLIDNTELWFGFLLARNKTSHIYDEDVAAEVYSEVDKLIPELERLIERLRNLK